MRSRQVALVCTVSALFTQETRHEIKAKSVQIWNKAFPDFSWHEWSSNPNLCFLTPLIFERRNFPLYSPTFKSNTWVGIHNVKWNYTINQGYFQQVFNVHVLWSHSQKFLLVSAFFYPKRKRALAVRNTLQNLSIRDG